MPVETRLQPQSPRGAIVAGCGYVGFALARLLQRAGWRVWGLTHSHSSAEALHERGLDALALDFTDCRAVQQLAHLPGIAAVVHCASSGRGGAEQYRQVYLEGMRNLIGTGLSAQFVFTSSSSVYAQIDGGWVTEESAAEPDRETGRILRETEDLTLAAGGVATRLAGIYGPGRSVLLRKFFSGEAVIEGDGSRWINQIHRDDAASALLTLIERGAKGIYNVADDAPVSQRELYERLAARFDRPVPPSGPIDPNRKRGWTHKRVSNARLRGLGWEPRYPSFFDAVEHDPELVAAVDPGI